MFVQYNPNPVRNTDDCVIRAVAKVLDEPWEKAYMKLCLKGLSMYDLPNNNAVWGALLRDKGFVREAIPNTCPDLPEVQER